MNKARLLCGWRMVSLILVTSSIVSIDSFSGEGSPSPIVALSSTLALRKNLKQAYEAALQRSESLAVQRELLNQASEGDTQALGAMLPTITGSYTRQQQAAPSSPTGNSIFPASQDTAKISAIQPLFRGLRDFAALRQRKHVVGAQRQALLNAGRQLFYDTSTAFYNVLTAEKDEANYLAEIELNRRRLQQLNAFFKIGRSQLTDVLTVKANIASLEVQLEATRGQLETAKDILAYLTGWMRETPLEDREKFLSTAQGVTPYLARIEERADVRAALENARANEEAISVSFGQHLPSLDLIGNYYFARPGVLSDVHYDFQIALSLPIFQGGVIQSQVRQAQSVSAQASLLLSQARRLAEQEVRIFFDAVAADQRQLTKLVELVETSKLNSETEMKYYQNGLVTNLDVLQALNTHRQAQRQLDRQTLIAKLDSVKLQAAAGERPEILLANQSEGLSPTGDSK